MSSAPRMIIPESQMTIYEDFGNSQENNWDYVKIHCGMKGERRSSGLVIGWWNHKARNGRWGPSLTSLLSAGGHLHVAGQGTGQGPVITGLVMGRWAPACYRAGNRPGPHHHRAWYGPVGACILTGRGSGRGPLTTGLVSGRRRAHVPTRSGTGRWHACVPTRPETGRGRSYPGL